LLDIWEFGERMEELKEWMLNCVVTAAVVVCKRCYEVASEFGGKLSLSKRQRTLGT
jgi:hypothetical protein